ncbi:MAG: SIR2 family protein [Candidatus Aminicenantes bacterium]|nr:MAG: SIR2 family protein [Candidatus Aminicenantes bacterium]
MEDLANERDAVVRTLSELNFVEPVNAEGLLPDGTRSWERIEKELDSCHLLILLIGERYGWTPDKGPEAEKGLSVTHLEVSKARQLGLPILPFLKTLRYETPRGTEDAKKRDAFRKEVKDWDKGYFVTEFDLASDLAKKVGRALSEMLADSPLKDLVKDRDKRVIPIPATVVPVHDAPRFDLDPVLIDLVRQQKAVLFAGAGMSLAAGIPSARALSENLIVKMEECEPVSSKATVDAPLHKIAKTFESACGRKALRDIYQQALSGPLGVAPTEAHRLSVHLFRRILTTNLDCLFESACNETSVAFAVIDDDQPIPDSDERTTIVKIDGSIASPEGMLLTANDFQDRHNRKPHLWDSLSRTISTSPMVVVGTSLRDPSLSTLFYSRDEHIPGYIVSPVTALFEQLTFQGITLRAIRADADTFFQQLTEAVDKRT